ncbi:MAG TPA: sigma-70 family RNA polymerase sigma factor, partial [Actinomycetota bacterium]|nr:sigma-70 family RNA polymerase sigma factor [Actinomycetota bacterium]
GDREIASDAVSEAFAQALRAWRGIRSPENWVWRVAFRIAAGEMKERRRFANVEEASYQLDERVQAVVSALARLSQRQRMAVVLHYYAGFTAGEIASMTGSASATVAVHLHRARRKLRELLEDDDE